MQDLLRTTAERAARYLADLKDRGVAPTPEALANLRRLDEPLPEHPTDPTAVIALLDDIGSPATMASAGGRFFGFVVGGSLPAAVAASNLGAAWDQNAGIVVLSPIAARLEQVAMRWLLDVLGVPPACGVGFVTCATQANFSGLAAARHALLARRGWNVEAQGLFGAPPITVVVGEEVHVSVLKALMLVGLGGERVIRVPVDGQGRMRGDAREPEHYPPEFSRRARGIEVWAALRSLGRQGLADLIERTCRHATRFAEGLREAGYEILNDVVINQVLVSFGDAELTRRVIAGIQADGTCWAGGSVWQGPTAMGISGASWATKADDV